MKIDDQKIYEDGEDFFELNGNAVMKLSPEAALSVCKIATFRRVSIGRIEGGIFNASGFEARGDCVWDSKVAVIFDSPGENNELAAKFILEEKFVHNAFILTV
ncbi:colicin immunity protein [Xylophilus rhododendri]|uniref:Colicin immunity protein n=1 Tax=Xylophilus rhododendri TaxID=2697032 RepID=A0A857J630_9BURK|nr:colicin immunity protein [Xylophilus rhododendri]QHI99286.1 colicin immunity protein [Xylophilus rhododendri]